jgi:hypothetical protein
MSEPIIITSQDPMIATLNFKPYRNVVERRVVPFLPGLDEAQTAEINTPWGMQLTAKRGDFLISEMDAPDDFWPIDSQIFDESYEIVRPGVCVKRALTLLVPLTDITGGDDSQQVTIVTLEGSETVSAGDFYLAKGVKGEIWPYPKEKVKDVMMPVE